MQAPLELELLCNLLTQDAHLLFTKYQLDGFHFFLIQYMWNSIDSVNTLVPLKFQ